MNSKGNDIYFIVLTQGGHQIQSHERENIDYGTVRVCSKFWNPESLGLNNICVLSDQALILALRFHGSNYQSQVRAHHQ